MVVLFSVIFMMSIQPVMMLISLIFIVFLYSLFMFNVMSSYWFGYVLVLVMLSGVLVVFTYVISLMPNESFELYNLGFIIIIIMFLYKMYIIMYKLDISYLSLNLWLSYMSFYNLFLVGFLLSIMIMVVWLSCLKEGAMRVMLLYAWLKD